MAKDNLTHVTMVVGKNNDAFATRVEKAANSLELRATVNLLKAFIGIEGEIKPNKAKVERINKRFENALKRGKVCESDIYFKDFTAAKSEMEKYLKGDSTKIAITPQQLNGLEEIAGLGKPKATTLNGGSGNKKKKVAQNTKKVADKAKKVVTKKATSSKKTKKVTKKTNNSKLSGIENEQEPETFTRFEVDLPTRNVGLAGNNPTPTHKLNITPTQESVKEEPKSSLFTPITENAPNGGMEKIYLPTDLGKFLGYVERYEYSILLRGEKGAGKTRMTYQMMNTFALAGFTVGCFTLEIGKHSNLVADMRNEYLDSRIANNIQIAEDCPNGLKDIEDAAKQFDVVCIDSWGKIPNTKIDDFDYLRKKYPKTMFIIIFQSTTNGTARGGSSSEYDAGIVIQIQKGGRAICEKNRYNPEDLTYLVFERKLEQTEELPSLV